MTYNEIARVINHTGEVSVSVDDSERSIRSLIRDTPIIKRDDTTAIWNVCRRLRPMTQSQHDEL